MVEKCSKGKKKNGDEGVIFDFQEHLLGGVSSFLTFLARPSVRARFRVRLLLLLAV